MPQTNRRQSQRGDQMLDQGRRDLIVLLGGAAAASSACSVSWPLRALAQQGTLPVIGLLHPGSPEANARYIAGFRKGLAETGLVEGRNVSIEYRWGHGEPTGLPELAAELVLNLKTAKTLGLDVPPMLLARADEVIE